MGQFSLVRGRALRATRTNGCGSPVLGPESVIVSQGFISVALTSNTEAGESISITNAAGNICVLDQPTPKFVNYGVVLNFCGVNPQLIELLTGSPLVLDGEGVVAGFRQNTRTDVDLVGFALELWTAVPTEECSEIGTVPYGYLLLPFIKGGVVGDISIENSAVNFTVTGCVTKDGSGWGVGPFDVTLDENGNPAPLATAITVGDHLHVEVVGVAPPAITDESYTALGTPATGATAGSPGFFTPANSYGPADLAAIQASSLTKSPGTAWTTGQSVILRDGTRAHWTSSAWAAGPA